MPVADLTFRKDLTVALTSTQVDGNFEAIRDFANGLETLYNTSFNQDGTFKVSVTDVNLQAGPVYYAVDEATTDIGGYATDSYVITLTPAITAYTDGLLVSFKANNANEAEASLNVNSLGAKPLRKRKDVALENGDIIAGQIVEARYDIDLGVFQITSELANQVGTTLGSAGQQIRVNSDSKLEFYTPTITAAEFHPHTTPYWAGLRGDALYGTDKDDDNVTTSVISGGETDYDNIEQIFPDYHYPYNSRSHRYTELTFDDDKLKTAGAGVTIAETSGLNILIQAFGGDATHGIVCIYNEKILKYIPLWGFEVGNWGGTGYAVRQALISCPRMDANEYKFKLIMQAVAANSDQYTGFKIMGHY